MELFSSMEKSVCVRRRSLAPRKTENARMSRSRSMASVIGARSTANDFVERSLRDVQAKRRVCFELVRGETDALGRRFEL